MNVVADKHVLAVNKRHAMLMAYTAVMVPVTDFLTGVLSALVIYGVGRKWFGEMAEPGAAPKPQPALARQRELAKV